MPTYNTRKQRLTDPEITTLYERLRCAESVSVHAGVSGSTVLAIVRRQGQGHLIGRRGPGSKGHYKPVGLPDEEIVARYLAGENGKQLALAANCSLHSIYSALDRAGVARRPSAPELQHLARTKKLKKEKPDHG